MTTLNTRPKSSGNEALNFESFKLATEIGRELPTDYDVRSDNKIHRDQRHLIEAFTS